MKIESFFPSPLLQGQLKHDPLTIWMPITSLDQMRKALTEHKDNGKYKEVSPCWFSHFSLRCVGGYAGFLIPKHYPVVEGH